MSNIRFELALTDDAVDELEDAIRDGIRNSVTGNKGNSLADEAVDSAQNRIRQRSRIWREELLNSFVDEYFENRKSTVLVIWNEAEHAAPVEWGAQYGDRGPPLDELLPWVRDNMGYWKAGGGDDGGDDGGPDHDGGGGSRGEPSESNFTASLSDASISQIRTGTDFGLDDTAESNNVLVIDYEDGSRAIFKSDSITGVETSAHGTRANEAAWTSVADSMDWELGPESSIATVKYQQDSITGSIQAWQFDSTPLRSKIASRIEPNKSYTPADFIDQHGERYARITLLDALLDNGDRHTGNMHIKNDLSELYAIDNGGYFFSGDLTEQVANAIPIDPVGNFGGFPELEQKMDEWLDMRFAMIDDLVDNADAILAAIERNHHANSDFYISADRLLRNDGQRFKELLSQLDAEWYNWRIDVANGNVQQSNTPSDSYFTNSLDQILLEADSLNDLIDLL